jgi:hypothetical protein
MDMRQFFNYWKGHSDRQREKLRINAIFAIQLRNALSIRDLSFSDLYQEDSICEFDGHTETKEEFQEKLKEVEVIFDEAKDKIFKEFTTDNLQKLGG